MVHIPLTNYASNYAITINWTDNMISNVHDDKHILLLLPPMTQN